MTPITVAPPARRDDAAFVDLLTVPMDLAAAGYEVTIMQSDAGWLVDVRKTVGGQGFHIGGEGRSYVATLHQLAIMAGTAVDDVERKARLAVERTAGAKERAA